MLLTSKRTERRARREKGQAIILFVVAMGMVLIAALGIAIDGSQLYAHRQMMQAAVDSAAQAGVMSVFNKTNTAANSNAYGTGGSFTCTTIDPRTPCYFARQNGVGATADDSVLVEFPTSAAGVNLSAVDTPNLVKVTATRTIHNGLIRFVSSSLSTIKASATAAIVDVVSPTPILILHPDMAGSLFINGNPTIQICGGPRRSIQVNSKKAATTQFKGSSSRIDLSHAGPNDPGNCTSGTGGDFGTFAGPTTRPPQVLVGSGNYIQPSSPILDPLASVAAPAVPAAAPAQTTVTSGVNGCPASSCKLYSPGLYPTGIAVKNESALFKPGIYYMQSKGFAGQSNGDMRMATGFANDPNTGQGMLIYITGNSTNDVFSVSSNGSINLVGTPTTSIYKGILLFSAHNSTVLKQHTTSGGGAIQLVGTLYFSNTNPTASVYQMLSLGGNSGNATQITGQIVVDALELGGTPSIIMTLSPTGTLHIRQVALINRPAASVQMKARVVPR